MSKLEKLTPSQEALMSVVRDEWIDFALNSNEPINKPAAKQGIEWMYSLAKLAPPEVVYAESPLACQIIANLYGNKNVWDSVEASVWASVGNIVGASVGNRVWASVWASVEASIGKSVWASVGNIVGASVGNRVWASVGNRVWASVRDSVEASVEASIGKSVWASVGDSVWASVGNSIGNSVRDSVGDSVEASVRDSNLKYVYPVWRDVLSDAGWVAFCDYFTRIGVVNHENFNRYVEYMKAGVFYGIFLNGVAIVCGRPKYIDCDSEGRLHGENRAAVLWDDGYAQYFWHGVKVFQKLIETPDLITKEDLIKEKNAEVRRAIMEKIGTDKFVELLDLIQICSDKIGTGKNEREAILYRTQEPDPVANEHIQFVKVICHSTDRQYFLCVPPEISSAKEAVAWTFGKEKDEYAPIIEA